MRQLIVLSFITLDGVTQAPGGPEEDPSGGFEHGGWSVGYWDDDMHEIMDRNVGESFDMVLGRKTYEIMAAYWPTAGEEGVVFNRAAKHVASTTLTDLAWENSRLIEPDVPAGIAALKQQDGPELQVHGSGNLVQTLLAHGLVDEFRLTVFPVVLGTGRRLFGDGTAPAGLELIEGRVTSSGVFAGTYRPAGEVKAGTFGG